MKRLVLLIATLLLLIGLLPESAFAEDVPPVAAGQSVIITEVKLGESLTVAQQPVREFVTLFNPNGAKVSLDGWTLEYAKNNFNSAECTIIPWAGSASEVKSLDGLKITANGVLSIGHESTLGFSLTDDKPGALRLIQPTEGAAHIVHDLVGWGDNATNPAPCMENAAAPLPLKGESIQRYLGCNDALPEDSDDNFADFFLATEPAHGELGGALLPECENEEEPPVQPLTCEGVVMSEILPNPASADGGSEFIELYNPTGDFIVLDGCGLQVNDGTVYVFSDGVELAPQEYLAFYDSQTGLTLPNSAGGSVFLLSPAQEELDNITYHPDLDDDVSWAWFGLDDWEATYSPTPGAENIRQPLKPCPAGQERNEETGQCRNIESSEESGLKPCDPGEERNPATNRCRKVASSSLKPCDPGQVRNPATNRCRSASNAAATLVPCKPGQERNPETNRCRKVGGVSTLKPCAAGQERNPDTNRCRKTADVGAAALPDVHDIQAVREGNPLRWWIAGGAVAIVAGYGIYEWRRDIAALLAKLKNNAGR